MYETLVGLFTDPLVVALLELDEDNDQLAETLKTWEREIVGRDPLCAFSDAVANVTGRDVGWCVSCSSVVWADETTCVGRREDSTVCESCLESYTYCDCCSVWVDADSITWLGDTAYCSLCRDSLSYCEECEEWYDNDYSDDHEHSGCDCSVPHPHFTFPANGEGFVSENQRLLVELPAGTIDESGITRIRRLLWDDTVIHDVSMHTLDDVLAEVGDAWQSRRGNFTRRLSSSFHKHGVKLSPGVVSEIGNLARAHSSDVSSWYVEVTRDLNQPADEFVHDDSCWWQSYSYSRCALKNWGGLGLRSYADSCSPSYRPTGRAWVQPLDDSLQPTHNAASAFAYVVFNGYGELGGYTAPRIIGHLSSRSYRRIGLCNERQYVNNERGYLVADAATCEETSSLSFRFTEHDTRDALGIVRAA